MTKISKTYLLKSNFDSMILEVNEKVINSSVLLKNMLECTEVTSTVPISINCTGSFLKIFIELIQIHEDATEDDDERKIMESSLFKDFTDEALANFIKEVCILDCDVLLNVVADIILQKLRNLTWIDINQYLKIENDFTPSEREWQNENMLKYFISLNELSSPLQFPLSCQSFYSINTKFSSSLNILLARICQRSDESIAFQLAQCCKALKNECDRHPIKVSNMFNKYFRWTFSIEKEKLEWSIEVEKQNEKYFSAIVRRKVMVQNDDLRVLYGHTTFLKPQFDILKEYLSLEWVVPHKNIKFIEVMFNSLEIFISNFDVKKLPFSRISFKLSFSDEIDFEFVYNCLIAKDISKEISLFCQSFTFSQHSPIRVSKKTNAHKFFECYFDFPDKKLHPKVKTFLTKYMDFDGHFKFLTYHSGCPGLVIHSSTNHWKYCFMSDILKYF